MLHIFIGSPAAEARAGATGKVVPGYEARIVGEEWDARAGGDRQLAVRGPTGCRYLDDLRQRDYVSEGWNLRATCTGWTPTDISGSSRGRTT